MNNFIDPKLFVDQPLSIDEVAAAVTRLGRDTLDLPSPAPANVPPQDIPDLPRMTAAQRFWLAFTGKPGSSGRAGQAYEPGLPRHAPPPAKDTPFGIPRQRRPR